MLIYARLECDAKACAAFPIALAVALKSCGIWRRKTVCLRTKRTDGIVPESTPPALHSELHALLQEMDGGAPVSVAWLAAPVTTKE